MKQIILSLVLITYIAAIDLKQNYGDEFHEGKSYERVKPFLSIDANTIAIDDISGDRDDAISLSGGWIYKKNNKFNVSYYNATKQLEDDDYIRINNYNVFYEYSFNNFGLQRGFYVGVGVARSNFTKSIMPDITAQDTNDTNGSTDVNATVNESFQVDFFARAGYEHKINNNYIIDISVNSSILPIGSRIDYKRVYYARLSIKYLFDIP